MGSRKRITEVALREFLLATLVGIRQQVSKCVEYGVTCRDVPAVTSTFLRKRLGFSDFRVRRFWSLANVFSRNIYVIYEYGDVKYWLLPEVHRRYLFATPELDFFMDVFDRREHFRGHCIELTNVPALYIYLVGRIGNDVIKINALYILSLIARKEPECFDKIVSFVEELLIGSKEPDINGVMECAMRMLKSWDYFKVFIPLLPDSVEALLIKCPILKNSLLNT